MLLMTFATKSLSLVPASVLRLATAVAGRSVAFVKAVLHRREVLRLSELDERGLKDIGLVRSDVDGALAVSWYRDPSAVLAARSKDRSVVAATRREEGLRQAQTAPAVRPVQPTVSHAVACSA